jgi:hypothetical protein
VPRAPTVAREQQPAALVAAAGATCVLVGSFLPWGIVRFGGVRIAELSPSGWAAGDGKVTVLIGIAALLIGGLLLVGRREWWLPVALFGGGAIAIGIGLLNDVDYHAAKKANDIAVSLGVPADGITAGAGFGPPVVILGGAALVVAAALSWMARVKSRSPGSPEAARETEVAP